MIGFSRTGMTLLETILSTQKNVVTLSEVDANSHVINVFRTELNKKYPQQLLTLTVSV
jgi:hypothetical protein